MSGKQKIGLIPHESNDSGDDIFDLHDTDVSLYSHGFVVDTVARLKYRHNGDSSVFAKFIYPFRTNEAWHCIYDVTATIRISPTEPYVDVFTSIKPQKETEAEVRKLSPDDNALCGINQDYYQCLLGEVPPGAELVILVKYVMSLDINKDGKPVYLFPNLLQGRDDATTKLHAVYKGYEGTNDNIYSSHSWKSSHRELIMDTVKLADHTDFELSGSIWGGSEEGCLQGGWENNTHENDVIGLSVTAPPSSTPTMSSSITNNVEVVFFIDRSGSMNSYDRIEHAKDTLLLFLKSLPVGCFFNVIGFGSSYRMLFIDGTKPYNADTLAAAVAHQESIEADLGCTQLSKPLKAVWKKKPKAGCQRLFFVLTDGYVDDSSDCLTAAKEHADTTRIYTFGIGSSVSASFLKNFAEVGGGECEFTTTTDRDMETKVMKTVQLALTTNFYDLSWDLKIPKGIQVNKDKLPKRLNAGQKMEVFFEVATTGRGTDIGKSKIQVTMSKESETSRSHAVELDWSSGNTYRKYYAMKRANDILNNPTVRNREEEAAKILESFHVASPTTAVVSRRFSHSAQVDGEACGYCNIHISNTDQSIASVPPAVAGPSSSTAAAATHITQTPRVLTIRSKRRRVLRDNLSGITNPAIKKISYRAGIKQMSSLVYEEMRGCLKWFLTRIIKDCVLYSEHAKRRTVIEEDVDKALRNNGVKIYGIEEYAPAKFEGEDKKKRNRRKLTGRVVKRTTPFGRPDATTSTVSSLLGVVRNDSQTKLKKQPSKSKSTKKVPLSKKPTLILDDESPMPSTSLPKPASTRSRTSVVSVLSRSSSGTRQGTKRGPDPSMPPPPAKTQHIESKTTPAKGRGKGKGKNTVRGRPRMVATPRTSRTRSTAANTQTGVPDFQAMISLITMQQFDGHWSLSADLANLIKKPLSSLMKSPVKDHEVWGTSIAVTWLELTFPEQRTEWEMIHHKAIHFLETHNLEGHTVTELQILAAKIVQ